MKTIKYLMGIGCFVLALASCSSNSNAEGDCKDILGSKKYDKLTVSYRVGDFHNGMAYIQDKQSDLYGFINAKGKVVVPCQYSDGHHFCEDMALVCLTTDEDATAKEYAYINKKGKAIVSGLKSDSYSDDFGDFSCGLAKVKTKALGTVFYNKKGEIAIDSTITAKYYSIDDFSEDLAVVCKKKTKGWGNLYGFINTKGEEVIPCTYESADEFQEGTAIVRIEQNDEYKSVLIDTKGEMISGKYDGIHFNANGYAFAGTEKGNKVTWTLLNNKGEELCTLPAYHEPTGIVSEGLAAVANMQLKDELEGYINLKGEVVIPCKYTVTYAFKDGKAWVEVEDDDEYYINKKGERIED